MLLRTHNLILTLFRGKEDPMNCSLSKRDGMAFLPTNMVREASCKQDWTPDCSRGLVLEPRSLVGRNPIAKYLVPTCHIPKISICVPLTLNRSFTLTFHAKNCNRWDLIYNKKTVLESCCFFTNVSQLISCWACQQSICSKTSQLKGAQYAKIHVSMKQRK